MQSALNVDELNAHLKQLLLIKAMRPDRFTAAAELLVDKTFGPSFLKQTEEMLNLGAIVEREIRAQTPVLMCSVTGFDASGLVEELAAETRTPIVSIAIGSAEGFTNADKAIATAAKSGRWVLLKNVHLAPHWLVQLEKKLHQVHLQNEYTVKPLYI